MKERYLIMSVNRYELKTFIEEKEKVLERQYPIDAMYCSRASLWGNGWRDGMVTEEEYKEAQTHYGRLWNYVGD